MMLVTFTNLVKTTNSCTLYWNAISHRDLTMSTIVNH